MPLRNSLDDREWDKFDLDGNGKTAVRVLGTFSATGGSASGLLASFEPFNFASAAYPDAVTEIYTYRNGGPSGVIKGTLTVVYTDSTKEFVSTFYAESV